MCTAKVRFADGFGRTNELTLKWGDESDLFVKEECAQLKSELPEVKNDCESSIAGLKAEVAPCTTQGRVVQLVKEYVWKSSRDACVIGLRSGELLEYPPKALGVFRWSVVVVQPTSTAYLTTVHSLEEKKDCGNQEGGWAYHYLGQAFHNSRVVK
jgi:hypothetical protein